MARYLFALFIHGKVFTSAWMYEYFDAGCLWKSFFFLSFFFMNVCIYVLLMWEKIFPFLFFLSSWMYCTSIHGVCTWIMMWAILFYGKSFLLLFFGWDELGKGEGGGVYLFFLILTYTVFLLHELIAMYIFREIRPLT